MVKSRRAASSSIRVGKGDGGVAPVGFHVAAEGGDLVRFAVDDDGHGAMVDPGRHHLQRRRLRQRHHRVGPRVGGDVDIGDRQAEERVAHAAADQKRLMPGPGQQVQHLLRRRRLDPLAGDPHAASRSASARRIRAVAPQM